ncbi:MAG: hypothetical protein ABSG98_07635 [Anaerolineales bacterium]
MDRVRVPLPNLAVKIGVAYLAMVIVVPEATTWMVDLQVLSRESIGSALRVPETVYLEGLNLASAPRWPDSLSYIHWINAHTPDSALIVEGGPLPTDYLPFHLLERLRFVLPTSVNSLGYGYADYQLVSASDREKIQAEAEGKSVLEAALSSSYVKLHHPDIFYVARGPSPLGLGLGEHRIPRLVRHDLRDLPGGNRPVIYWTAFALITVVAYLWPGYALLSCVELEGVGRWGRLLFALPTSLIVLPCRHFELCAIRSGLVAGAGGWSGARRLQLGPAHEAPPRVDKSRPAQPG